jgi:hypothetical protein
MSRGRRSHNPRRFLLDYGRVEDIPKSKAREQQLLKYYWNYYSEAAFQRAQIYDALKKAARERTVSRYRFGKWQRAVKYRFSLHPLGTQGSLSDPGGRFNIGAIDSQRYSQFPALYIAANKSTALDELFARDKQGRLLEPEELALTRTASITVVSVSGMVESAIDLRDANCVAPLVDLLKGFTISDALANEADQLGIARPRFIKNLDEMMGMLLDPDWRYFPMQWDVPANSQIFGQIVMEAGIDGIIYPSVLTRKSCLAIYIQNFLQSSSFIEIDDAGPSPGVPRRIDSTTYKDFL